MYTAFKEIKQSLPGESEILVKTQTPSVKVYLYPFKTDQSNLALPRLSAPQLVLQRILPILTLKKYLSSKFEKEGLIISPDDITILYKNQPIPDHFKLGDAESIYKFPTDKQTVFHYMRKE
jgi:hypothetical protein